jgi:hypothetical protein
MVTEKGIKNVPQLARELLLERAQALLTEGDAWPGCASQKARLEAVVAGKGSWETRDLLVVNPEGDDLADAQVRIAFLAAKVHTLSLCLALASLQPTAGTVIYAGAAPYLPLRLILSQDYLSRVLEALIIKWVKTLNIKWLKSVSAFAASAAQRALTLTASPLKRVCRE